MTLLLSPWDGRWSRKTFRSHGSFPIRNISLVERIKYTENGVSRKRKTAFHFLLFYSILFFIFFFFCFSFPFFRLSLLLTSLTRVCPFLVILLFLSFYCLPSFYHNAWPSERKKTRNLSREKRKGKKRRKRKKKYTSTHSLLQGSMS